MAYAYVDELSGRINNILILESGSLQTLPDTNIGEIVVETSADSAPDTHYYNGTSIVSIPESPGPGYVFDFDTETWVDPRTQAEYDAYKARVRSETYMTRYEFVKAIDAMDNDFSDEDLQMLARGEFPAIVESVLATMAAEESKDAKFKWAAMNTVCRTDALIINLAAAMGFSEFDLDDTFGIVLDPPPV